MNESRFENVDAFALDEAFSLTAQFNADTNPKKVSLGAGVYRDGNGEPWRLPAVVEVRVHRYHVLVQQLIEYFLQAKKRLDAPNQYHEYLPIQGFDAFLNSSRDLIFGPESESHGKRIASVQTISGTGANNLGALFLAQHLKPRNVWIPDPTCWLLVPI